MEFKIGDKVRVLDREEILNAHIDYSEFKQELERYCGKEGTVVSRYYDATSDTWIYKAVFDFEGNVINDCVFSDWMLEEPLAVLTEDTVTVNLKAFSDLEELLGFVKLTYEGYYADAVIKEAIQGLEPTREEIELLDFITEIGGEIFFVNQYLCYVEYKSKRYRMSALDRFSVLRDYRKTYPNLAKTILYFVGGAEHERPNK